MVVHYDKQGCCWHVFGVNGQVQQQPQYKNTAYHMPNSIVSHHQYPDFEIAPNCSQFISKNLQDQYIVVRYLNL